MPIDPFFAEFLEWTNGVPLDISYTWTLVVLVFAVCWRLRGHEPSIFLLSKHFVFQIFTNVYMLRLCLGVLTFSRSFLTSEMDGTPRLTLLSLILAKIFPLLAKTLSY